MFGAKFQKYTTLLYTAGFDSQFEHLDELRCNHCDHEAQVGGTRKHGEWTSKDSSAYPADLNLTLAKAIAALTFGDTPSISTGAPNLGAEHADSEPPGSQQARALTAAAAPRALNGGSSDLPPAPPPTVDASPRT